MKLRTAHIVLMSAAIGLGVLLAIYGLRQLGDDDGSQGIGLAAGGVAMSVSVAFYLRAFVRKG